MLSLPFICDLYNPLLLTLCLIACGIQIKNKAYASTARFIVATLVVYGLMFLDKQFNWWPRLGLDYSTHTATALAMCLFLGAFVTAQSNKIKNLVYVLLVPSLITYGQLMVVLHYHTWADILSTAVVVGVLLSGILFWKRENKDAKTVL